MLIYGYAHGQRSSRQLERLCEVDVAFRVITGNEIPDHSTLARFRARNETGFGEVFTQVLLLCAQSGLVKVGGADKLGRRLRRTRRCQRTLLRPRCVGSWLMR